MAYAKIRVREISAGEVGGTDIHNDRLYDEHPEVEIPDNIKRDKDYKNISRYYLTKEDGTRELRKDINLKEALDSRLKQSGCKVKSNSVLALEFVCSLDPELTAKLEGQSFRYLDQCQLWLMNRYGAENVIARWDHNDETNPHMHIVITPIVKKEVKWKNANGEGIKTENRLCARDITGEKPMLEKLQDDFHEFTKEYGKKYDVEFYRGLKASEQLKVYTKKTDHLMGILRKKLAEVEEKAKDISLEINTEIYEYNSAINLLHANAEKARLEFEEKHRKNEEVKEMLRNYGREADEIQQAIAEQERNLIAKQSEVAREEQKRQRVNTSLDENGIARWKKGEEYFHGNEPKKKQFKR